MEQKRTAVCPLGEALFHKSFIFTPTNLNQPGLMADMEVDKVADMVAYMVVDMDGGRQKN